MCIVSFHRPHGIRKYTIHPPVGMRDVYAHFMRMINYPMYTDTLAWKVRLCDRSAQAGCPTRELVIPLFIP